MIRSVITGTGSALPANCVSNADLAERVDTSDEWIVERTGIRQRYIAGEGETTSTLAIDASRKALAAAGVDADEIGLIILATATPDHTFPATATQVQAALGCGGGVAFDVQAVCSGFLYALATADSLLRTGMAKKALVIGSETFSRILDWDDRTTCVLFGDGAGGLQVEAHQRRHRPLAQGHGFLHSAAAGFQQRRRIGDGKTPHGGQGRILAEGMAGDEGCRLAKINPAVLGQHPNHRQADGHDRRLRVLGQDQFVIRALEHQLRQVLAEGFVYFLENLPGRRECPGDLLAHADDLGRLAGKNERARHALNPCRSTLACGVKRRKPSVKVWGASPLARLRQACIVRRLLSTSCRDGPGYTRAGGQPPAGLR